MTKKNSKKRLLVLGAGESGAGAAILAGQKGWEVFVSDAGLIPVKYQSVLLHHEIEFETGGHVKAWDFDPDEMMKSPGIPDHVLIVEHFRGRGVPVISEIELAGRYTGATKICITGSNGKTTTSTWIHHILNKSGMDARLTGNVGRSLAWELAEGDHACFVIEISSFQLDGMYTFKPDIAVLTNITPDHLDRYGGDFSKYAASKFRILDNMSGDGHFIYNGDDRVIMEELEKRDILPRIYPVSLLKEPIGDGAFIRNNQIIIKYKQTEFAMSIEALALQGRHNLYNSMAAAVAGKILDIRNELIKESLMDFQGVEHRLEMVAKVHGIEFINDSKATNVNSAWYALESQTHPVIWIAGGQDKGNHYEDLKPLVQSKVKALICLGADNRKLLKAFKGDVDIILETADINEAVRLSYNLGKPGDVVLLSPACASFDLFVNFEERGRLFKRAVYEL
jgi:UDP-N-acetylmuramoylalanine--D-glutamate ligase